MPGMATTRALLVGERPRLAIGLVGGFALGVTLAILVAMFANARDVALAATVTDRAVPLLLFYAPGPLAAVGGYARCGGPACLAVGVVPALTFVGLVAVGGVVGVPGVGGGDAPLTWLAGTVAVVGVAGAFIGYCVGVAAAMIGDLLGADGADPDV